MPKKNNKQGNYLYDVPWPTTKSSGSEPLNGNSNEILPNVNPKPVAPTPATKTRQTKRVRDGKSAKARPIIPTVEKKGKRVLSQSKQAQTITAKKNDKQGNHVPRPTTKSSGSEHLSGNSDKKLSDVCPIIPIVEMRGKRVLSQSKQAIAARERRRKKKLKEAEDRVKFVKMDEELLQLERDEAELQKEVEKYKRGSESVWKELSKHPTVFNALQDDESMRASCKAQKTLLRRMEAGEEPGVCLRLVDGKPTIQLCLDCCKQHNKMTRNT